jgi:sugar phosphate permease
VSRYRYIVALVIAGEMVFGLPFHIARFFRPTMLEVFEFTNTQLGDLFAVYGITAMLSYFPGGAIADRYSARFLLTASLVSTAAGGFYLATIPGPFSMAVLYGYWGVTTVFLLWGALIRATRDWGGDSSQGKAFGILEAGRGVVAAVVAGTLVMVLASYLPGDANLASDQARRDGFQMVVLGYSLIALFAGALAWFVIPGNDGAAVASPNPFRNMSLVVAKPIVWAQAAVIVCAYCGYKSLDYYSLYAVEVLGMDEVEGAWLASWGAYVRPVAALAAGLIADRFSAARSIGVIFSVMAVVFVVLSMLPASTSLVIVYATIGISLFAVFSLRGIYFALLQEVHTPRYITGASVGLISLVGYTPDIFMAPVAGRILDATPGAGGFVHLFWLLTGIAVVGIAVIAVLLRVQRNNSFDESVCC